MPRRKRRIRSPHPGVVLKERVLPSGKSAWRARFDDPDTGREVYVTLSPIALPTHEARRAWAIQRSKTLWKRQTDIDAGAPKRVQRTFEDATADYTKGAKARLRDKTLATYRPSVDRLVAWAAREGLKHTAELTQAHLAAFRDHVIGVKRHGVTRGGKRGQRHETSKKRSPNTVNSELRAVKTVLNAWRLAGLTPHVTRDTIADALKALPVPHEQAAYLPPAQIRKLLEAAQRHDAYTFAETRDEHAGRGTKGSTKRYDAIAPFVAFLLLTGCRRGEALGLRWADVDLVAVDHEGREVGEIRLSAAATKTNRARTVGLEVSPALRSLLSSMRLRARKAGYVFHSFNAEGDEVPYTVDIIEAARERLVETYGAPKFDWQTLRSTCATYLTNAPGIFGNATAFLSAKQLGHSVTVAEKHYLGVHRGIARDARTLEAAMQVETALSALDFVPRGAALSSVARPS
jgi:site-specific recombinase XerD